MSGQSGGRIRLAELNEQLTCNICHGYFIDATTIIECLHSFCRSCIVRYLETNKYCPICEVQVHKSKPLLNIRPDHTLQDIVYKLVPGCYQNEMRCRREFYKKHPDAQTANMSPEARGEPIESHIYSPDETLTLSLEYYNPNNINEVAIVPPIDSTKDSSNSSVSDKVLPGSIIYLRCPAAVTVFHLQKLMRGKHGLTDAHRVDVMYKEELLCSTYTLMDVMYIYHWRRKVPLRLSYRIFQSSTKRIKVSDDNPQYKELLNSAGISSVDPKEEQSNSNNNNTNNNNNNTNNNNNINSNSNSTTSTNNPSNSNSNSNNAKVEYKEVQLKISETGIMSITGISSSPESKKGKTEDETVGDSKKSFVEIKEKVHLATGEQSKDKSIESDSRKSSKNLETKLTNFNNNTSGGSSSSAISNATESTSKVETREKTKQSLNAELKNSKVAGGSKIDSLSAKLQFQPKLAQVNQTYSKRTPKEKKTGSEKMLKKSEGKNADKNRNNAASTNITAATTTTSSNSSSSSSNSVTGGVNTNKSGNLQSKMIPPTASSSSASADNLNSNTSIYSSPSVSISISTRRNSSPDRNKEANLSKRRSHSGESNEKTSVNISHNNRSFTRQNNHLMNENLANIGLSVSTTTVLNVGQSGSTYTVQDLVSNPNKSTTKLISNQKCPSLNNQEFVIPTSNQSSSSLTANASSSSSSSSSSNSSSSNTNSSTSSNNNRQGNLKGSLEITSVYSVPPCPDAIPISMIKPMPTVRKTEILAKGSNINEICAKIGNSGSKINDICAKIGENSKEKNKIERSRPEIPDLLKITKKSNDLINIKHIPNIPNVPSYIPSNSLVDSKNIYLNKDNNKLSNNTVTITTTTSNTNPSSTIVNIDTSDSVTITSTMQPTSTNITAPISSASSQQIPFQLSNRSSNNNSGTSCSNSGIGGNNNSNNNSIKKTQSSSVGYKTLREPPKPWNPTLSKNNYVAMKNQAKEMQNQTSITSSTSSTTSSSSSSTSGSLLLASSSSTTPMISTVMSSLTTTSGTTGLGDSGKSIASKPAKIYKGRNVPRYLGNPASGVKPMYVLNNSDNSKDNSKELASSSSSSSSSSTTTITSSSSTAITSSVTNTTTTTTSSVSNVAIGSSNVNKNNNPSGLSMTKIDPKTLSAIVSNNNSCNSPIVSPPPYSPNARSYQNTPFPRSIGSPISPRNSPVSMLSTNPFIQSPIPNTNPRLIYPHYSPYPDTSRFSNPLVRSPIGITPSSAFHSSLPPSINKIYQRSSYIPQTTSTNYQGLTTPTPTVQRIPPSTHSSPKSKTIPIVSVPVTTSVAQISNVITTSTYSLLKSETQTSNSHVDSNPNNLNKNTSSANNNSNSSSNNNNSSSQLNSKTTENISSNSNTTTSSSNINSSTTITTPSTTTTTTSSNKSTNEPLNAFNLSKTPDSRSNNASDLSKQSSSADTNNSSSDKSPRNISIMANLNQSQKKVNDNKKLKGSVEKNKRKNVDEDEDEDEDDDDDEDDDEDDFDDEDDDFGFDDDDDDDDEDDDDDDDIEQVRDNKKDNDNDGGNREDDDDKEEKKKKNKEKQEKKRKLEKDGDKDEPKKVSGNEKEKSLNKEDGSNDADSNNKKKKKNEDKANSETSDKKKKKVKLLLNKSKNQTKTSVSPSSTAAVDSSKKDNDPKSDNVNPAGVNNDEAKVKLNGSTENSDMKMEKSSEDLSKTIVTINTALSPVTVEITTSIPTPPTTLVSTIPSTSTTTMTTTPTTSSPSAATTPPPNQDSTNDKSESIIYPDSDKSSKDLGTLRHDELNKTVSNDANTKKVEPRNKAES